MKLTSTFVFLQVSSEKYQNETMELQKRLQEIKLQKSVFRRHLSNRHVSSVSLCSFDDTSLWSPMTDTSVQLSDSQYSMSTCVESPHNPNNGSLCYCDSRLECSHDGTTGQSISNTAQRKCLSDCVRQLMFGDVTDVSLRSHDSSFSFDSGYTSLPDPDSISAPSRKLNSTSTTLDSDATGFAEAPLSVHRPVTHKAANHRIIAKQLKRVGKHIHKHGIDSCMSTLAVL